MKRTGTGTKRDYSSDDSRLQSDDYHSAIVNRQSSIVNRYSQFLGSAVRAATARFASSSLPARTGSGLFHSRMNWP